MQVHIQRNVREEVNSHHVSVGLELMKFWGFAIMVKMHSVCRYFEKAFQEYLKFNHLFSIISKISSQIAKLLILIEIWLFQYF